MENAVQDLTVAATRTTVADLVTSLAKPNTQSYAWPADSFILSQYLSNPVHSGKLNHVL